MTSLLPKNSDTSPSSPQRDGKTTLSSGTHRRQLMALFDYEEGQRCYCQSNKMHQCRASSIDQMDNSLLHKQHTVSSTDPQHIHLVTTVEYIHQKRLYHGPYEIGQARRSSIEQQDNLLLNGQFTSLSSNKYERSHMTVAEYAHRRHLRHELNSLNTKSFEIDVSIPSPIEQQNILSINPRFRTSFDNKHEIRIIRMAEYMRQNFFYHQSLEIRESTSSAIEHQDTLSINSQPTTSSRDTHDRRLMTLAEYARRRRLRHELPQMKQERNLVRHQESATSYDNADDRHFIASTAYAQCKCWHNRQCETNQSRASSVEEHHNLLSCEQSITSSNDEHQEEFVTLAQYIEMNGLDPEWFEMDVSISSTIEQQDILLPNSQNIVPADDEEKIRLTKMAEYMDEKPLGIHEPLAHRKQQRRNWYGVELGSYQSMNDVEPINRNDKRSSIKVLSVDQCVFMRHRYKFEKSKTNAYAVKQKCRIFKIFSRSPHITGSQNRAQYENKEPSRTKTGLLACIGRDMFRCFRRDHMQETPIFNHREII